MVVLFSLVSAALFGTGDFCGGQAAKRAGVIPIVAGSNLIGLLLVLVFAPSLAERFDGADFLTGMVGGLFGLVGISLLYRNLSRGPMAVVAPIAALTNAVVPVLWGVGFGERPTSVHAAGIMLGFVAIVLVSRPPETAGVVVPGLVFESVLAGVGFAGFFIALDATDLASSPWPIVVLAAVLAVVPRARTPVRDVRWLILACGFCDCFANVLMLEALGRGMLSLVAVLTSLYPAATVLLARIVLQERIGKGQLVGLVGTLGAVVLIVTG
jgi:drug/metabolite transporter (DMT)-like permease